MIYQLTITICHRDALAHFSFIVPRATFLCSTVVILPTFQCTLAISLIFNNKFWLDGRGVDSLIVEKPLNLIGYVHVIVWRSTCNMGRC